MKPNPSNGNLTLEYTIEGNETAELCIYDVTGRRIKQQVLASQYNKINVDATGLSGGVYYYDIKEGSKKVKAGKLVIVK